MPARRSRFVFFVHPRTDVRADMRRVARPLGAIPNAVWEQGFARLPVRPFRQAEVRAADRPDEPLGWVVAIPLTPRQLLSGNRQLIDRKIDDGIRFARSLGADLVGLGALTAPATGGGTRLQDRTDVGVTNGNAFTASATADSIIRATRGLGRPATIALVGASGSVGSAVTRVVARSGVAQELILIGRTIGNIAALAGEFPDANVTASTAMDDCVRADVVVLMTSASEAILASRHLRPGALVIDDTQPRNADEALLTERPDITIVDGGLVATPGLVRRGGSIGIARESSFACLAETALLALSGHTGHGTIGRPTLEQVDTMTRLAGEFSHLGFGLSAPTSFGEPIDVAGWNIPGAGEIERDELELDDLIPDGDGVAA